MYRGIIFFLNKTLSAKILHLGDHPTWYVVSQGGYEPFIARLTWSLGDVCTITMVTIITSKSWDPDGPIGLSGWVFSRWKCLSWKVSRSCPNRTCGRLPLPPVKHLVFSQFFFYINLVQTEGTCHALILWTILRILHSNMVVRQKEWCNISHVPRDSMCWRSLNL